jgi:CHAT domain-containing protein
MIHAKLQFQLASALARMHRFPEAEPIYREAIEDLEEQGDLDSTARILAAFGAAALEVDRLPEAQTALDKALWLVRIHHLTASANVLRGLAQVSNRMGDPRSAASLFNAAIEAPSGLTPRWLIYVDRARFRLDHDDLAGALQDFREARRIAILLRADIVPADQDRITFESGLNRLGAIGAGLIDAGNRMAQKTSDRTLLEETFDTAEQDRLWSLRSLVPSPNDWRTRLPDRYWDLLARYQSLQRDLMTRPSSGIEHDASALQLELQNLEAAAGSDFEQARDNPALEHAKGILDSETVLFSFSISESGGWVWAVDRGNLDVFPVPSQSKLKASVTEFALATRKGDAAAATLGSRLYKDLFGAVPARYLAHKRWLLELDGPLFALPLAALVVDSDGGKNEPIYLVERAALQVIPGALMLQARAPSNGGAFLGIGDPVYNAADARFKGNRPDKENMALPRLTATAAELRACSRASGAAKSQILTGEDAGLAKVRQALLTNPSVVHFATHIIRSPRDHSSGLIALSLDRSGALEFMDPTEIIAHPISTDLVVLNGCHSGQGEALPGAGLMGLTRAWIGAGAKAVLATSWDIPDQDSKDEGGKALITEFYRASRAQPDRGPAFALQSAQLAALQEARWRHSESATATWAAYFLLGRE